MSLRCKPGDLALVIRCKHTPELVGKVVLVERHPNEIEHIPGGPFRIRNWQDSWMVSSSKRGELLPLKGVTSVGVLFDALVPLRPIKDYCLMPLRPGEPESDHLDVFEPDLIEDEA